MGDPEQNHHLPSAIKQLENITVIATCTAIDKSMLVNLQKSAVLTQSTSTQHSA
jgi:hypothetical protein